MDKRTASLVIKAGKDNGFEVGNELSNSIELCSARHPLTALISFRDEKYYLKLTTADQSILWLIKSHFSHSELYDYVFTELAELGNFLKQTVRLFQSSPEQLAIELRREVSDVLAAPESSPEFTEALREVRQRVGQDKYRKALMEYWDGKCAVTGIAIPEVLRASHAKPWAECSSDLERLDKYNGFLLSANIDALFDKFLISFTKTGEILISATLNSDELEKLGINNDMRLRKIEPSHERYLSWHRERFEFFPK